MEPLKRVHSRTLVIPSSNIDTDQIIPARFLTTTTKDTIVCQRGLRQRCRGERRSQGHQPD